MVSKNTSIAKSIVTICWINVLISFGFIHSDRKKFTSSTVFAFITIKVIKAPPSTKNKNATIHINFKIVESDACLFFAEESFFETSTALKKHFFSSHIWNCFDTYFIPSFLKFKFSSSLRWFLWIFYWYFPKCFNFYK